MAAPISVKNPQKMIASEASVIRVAQHYYHRNSTASEASGIRLVEICYSLLRFRKEKQK